MNHSATTTRAATSSSNKFPRHTRCSVATTGPADTNLTLSIVGPPSCHPRWTNPFDPSPIIITIPNQTPNQISTVTLSSVGAGTTIVEYTISCDTPGAYNLQITANVSSPSMPNDPNPADNQAENNVQVNVVLGDDVGVTVVKEEQITTQKDVTSTHDMTITVTNGNHPANVHLTVLAVSKLGVCEARLIPVAATVRSSSRRMKTTTASTTRSSPSSTSTSMGWRPEKCGRSTAPTRSSATSRARP